MKEDTLNLLNALIANGAVTSKVERVNRSVDMVAAFLAGHGVPCVRRERVQGRDVLWASNRPGKEAEVVAVVHLDVVPPSEEGQFSPYVREGWLYGRGSGDDLGNAAVAAQWLCGHSAGERGIAVLFATDEEDGGLSTAHMVELGYRATQFAVVMDAEYLSLVTAEKGMLGLRVTACGVSCHSSAPWEGRNPITLLMSEYGNLRQAFARRPQATAGDVWHATMEPCVISGGVVDNQVPDQAWMKLNIRYTSEPEKEELLRLVREQMPHCRVEVERECRPVFCDEAHPVMQRLMAALEEVAPAGRRPCFARICGATDARHLADWKVPVAISGVNGINAHARGEAVELDSLDRMLRWFNLITRTK